MLKKLLYLLLLVVVIESCKSTKTAAGYSISSMSAKKVVKNYDSALFNKETINASIKAKYNGGNVSQTISIKMRMQKDSIIWMSGRFLGIPVAKILITPNSVQFYEKLSKTSFNGNFELLSDFLGTEVDFSMIQNLLVGQALESLEDRKFQSEIVEESYRLEPKEQQQLYDILFWINPMNFKINKQEIRQVQQQKKLMINYSNYQSISGIDFPKRINIIAVDKSERTFLDLEYKSVEFDRRVSFPFSIPAGYKQINLNE